MPRDCRSLLLQNISVQLGGFELQDVSFQVAPGEIVGYLGHNGAGKTTTFRIIADLVRPSSGSVTLGRLDHRKNERAFKRSVSVVGGNSHVYASMRVGEALDFASKFYPHWDHAWCSRMCEDLHLPTQTRVRHLSTGMNAKLGLVLGLSPRPHMLILDEPTSGLDVESAEWIWNVVESQARLGDLGVLLSSHSEHEVLQHCSRVLVLRGGRVGFEIDLVSDPKRAERELSAALRQGAVHAD